MDFKLDKTKIIALSVTGALILGAGGYFGYQKFFKQETPTTPVVSETTTDTSTTDQTQTNETNTTNENENTDSTTFENELNLVYDSITSKTFNVFKSGLTGSESFEVVKENLSVENKLQRKLGLNSNVKLKNTFNLNQVDVESAQPDVENKTLEETNEEECAEGETCEKKEDGEKKVEININGGKKEGSYNGIKGDFDGELGGELTFTNKNVDKTKNEELKIKFLGKYSGNQEKENFETESFSLKTNINEIDDLSKLDDYLFLKKFLNLSSEKNGQFFKNFSFISFTNSLFGFFDEMKSNNVIELSNEPFSSDVLEEGKEETSTDTSTEETTKEEKQTETASDTVTNTENKEVTEGDKETTTVEEKDSKEIMTSLNEKETESTGKSKEETSTEGVDNVETTTEKKMEESNTEEKKDQLENILDTETSKNTEIAENTESSSDGDKESLELSQEQEAKKMYFKINNEKFKEVFSKHYSELSKFFKLMNVEIGEFTDEDFEKMEISGTVELMGEKVTLNIEKGILGSYDFKGVLDNEKIEMKGKEMTFSLHNVEHDTKIIVKNKKEKKTTKITLKTIQNHPGISMISTTTSKKKSNIYKNVLKLESVLEKGNKKIPALFVESDENKPQIKLEKIIQDYSQILQKGSELFKKEGSQKQQKKGESSKGTTKENKKETKENKDLKKEMKK